MTDPVPIRTSLQRFGQRRTPEQVMADGFREQGIFAVSIHDKRLDPFERQFILTLGERLHGSRVQATGTGDR